MQMSLFYNDYAYICVIARAEAVCCHMMQSEAEEMWAIERLSSVRSALTHHLASCSDSLTGE